MFKETGYVNDVLSVPKRTHCVFNRKGQIEGFAARFADKSRNNSHCFGGCGKHRSFLRFQNRSIIGTLRRRCSIWILLHMSTFSILFIYWPATLLNHNSPKIWHIRHTAHIPWWRCISTGPTVSLIWHISQFCCFKQFGRHPQGYKDKPSEVIIFTVVFDSLSSLKSSVFGIGRCHLLEIWKVWASEEPLARHP